MKLVERYMHNNILMLYIYNIEPQYGSWVIILLLLDVCQR